MVNACEVVSLTGQGSDAVERGMRDCETVGRARRRDIEAAGRAGLGLAPIIDCFFNFLIPERVNGSLKLY